MMEVKVHEGNRIVITNELYTAEFFIKPCDDPNFVTGQDNLVDLQTLTKEEIEKYTDRLSRFLTIPDDEFDAIFGDKSSD